MWTLIRLLLEEQSDLGPNCLQKCLLKSQADDKADDNCCDCLWVNALPYLSKNLNKTILLPIDVSKHYWMSGKQSRPQSDGMFSGL